MTINTVPEELLALRDKIDAIDQQLLELLSRRFEVTREVGRIKARSGLESVDIQRERQKLERLRNLADEYALNSEFVHQLFQSIFREVVENHREYLRREE